MTFDHVLVDFGRQVWGGEGAGDGDGDYGVVVGPQCGC